MSEILTNLFLHIDKFQYPKTISKIEKDDIAMLNKAKSDLIYKPSIALLLTFILSRKRDSVWNHFKKSIQKHRNVEIDYKGNFSTINTSNKKIVLNNDALIENLYQKVEMNNVGSRVIKSRRKVENAENVVLPRRAPTFSQEHFLGVRTYTAEMKDLPIKQSLFRFFRTDKGNFLVRAKRYIMKTNLIYIPFLFLFLIYLYEFGVTTVGLYFKYQPLIDQYYIDNNLI